MSHEIIFHNFPSSPFSEKVRIVFGIKGLTWRDVEIPSMLPKPDLTPMTGGYRKTPVMQIGADIYCDSQIILREIERRHPKPSVTPYAHGIPFGVAFWTDRLFFMSTVPVIFGEIGHTVPEAFKKDREAMSGGIFNTDAMKAAAPFMKDQFRAHAAFVEDQLADGRKFIGGAEPGLMDAHCHMNFWFLRNATPHNFVTMTEEFSHIRPWVERVDAIGHGNPVKMDSKEALAICKAATPEAKSAADPHDPNGRKPGDKVKVAADDYGRDQIAGELVFSNAHEIAIRRSDPAVGEVVVHFPRAGFVVSE